MSELVGRKPGFAIISRMEYSDRSDHRRLLKTDQFNIGPGQGILFTGQADNPQEAIQFDQSKMDEAISSIPTGTLQMIAIVDMNTGALLLTDGTADNSVGIDDSIDLDLKVVAAELGRISFAGIWGRDKEEAYNTLRALQDQRVKLN